MNTATANSMQPAAADAAAPELRTVQGIVERYYGSTQGSLWTDANSKTHRPCRVCLCLMRQWFPDLSTIRLAKFTRRSLEEIKWAEARTAEECRTDALKALQILTLRALIARAGVRHGGLASPTIPNAQAPEKNANTATEARPVPIGANAEEARETK